MAKERDQAEEQFKQTQKEKAAKEGKQAMSEYVAQGHSIRAKMARQKEQRLAKEAADKARKPAVKGAKPSR